MILIPDPKLGDQIRVKRGGRPEGWVGVVVNRDPDRQTYAVSAGVETLIVRRMDILDLLARKDFR